MGNNLEKHHIGLIRRRLGRADYRVQMDPHLRDDIGYLLSYVVLMILLGVGAHILGPWLIGVAEL